MEVHQHSPTNVRANRQTRLILALLLLPALLITIWGLVATWPQDAPARGTLQVIASNSSEVRAEVTGLADESGLVPGKLSNGTQIDIQFPPEQLTEGVPIGSMLRVLYIPESESFGSPYMFMDFVRDRPIMLLVIGYVLIVGLVAKWRGLASILGLLFSFAVIALYTLPSLLTGGQGLTVALLTSSTVMFVVLYTAHGISARTSTALLGTLIGLLFTGALAAWATKAAMITGLSDEYARSLPGFAPDVDLRALVLCGTILACLGALNDVTITQASAVWELREVSPKMSRLELFRRSMRIGQDHIASTVYTITFAYLGASLPLFLIVSLVDENLTRTLTTGEIATEVVRTLIGSIGLVLAIPITTSIAVFVVPKPAARHALPTN